jgi:lipopolysaccharide/colanic/teichoic acid biosynthesis glycosyltransferase/glycosyltransferase involved in cell wall biosynthesis
MPDQNLLSIVIPCRNEAKYIACCLDSIVNSDYPKDRLEVLVMDGQSEDGTLGILQEYQQRYSYISVLDNPQRRTPCALNIGIRAARGHVILRMDAHARVTPFYLSQCVRALDEHGADNVGGVIETIPTTDGTIGRAIVYCLSHRFGVGNSAFRTGVDGPTEVDTVFGGCYRREVFEKVGLFNEQLARSQDIEFNRRLRHAGGRIVLVPGIVSQYYARSEYGPFVRHNFLNGRWSVLPFLYSSVIPVSARHLVPLVFVSALLGALAMTVVAPGIGKWALAAVAVPYAAVSLIASISATWHERRWRALFVLPLLFITLHISYGLGSLCGVVQTGVELAKRRLSPGRTPNDLIRRVIDLLVAAAALTILSPLLIAIAIMIKREDGGPVFYRGSRVGRFGAPLRMVKFRTMVLNAERIGGSSTSDDDPRITKTGTFLRKYKLDELPQLINVLLGEMHLVGPRPEVQKYVDRYSGAEREILNVCPGITDWASIWNSDEGSVLAGSPDPERAFEELIQPTKIKLQLLYVRNRSLRGDAKILFYTVRRLIDKSYLPPELAEYGQLVPQLKQSPYAS